MIALATFFFLAGCGSREEKLFTLLDSKVTDIDFVNEVNETETFNIISYEYMYNGAGVAAGATGIAGAAGAFGCSGAIAGAEPRIIIGDP